jgi:hypothetical protein
VYTKCIFECKIKFSELLFIWRKCGVFNDSIHSCKNHDVSIKEGDTHSPKDLMTEMPETDGGDKAIHQRLASSSFGDLLPAYVEVCVAGCATDGCVVSSSPKDKYFELYLIIAFLACMGNFWLL